MTASDRVEAAARALGYRDESGWDQCDDETNRVYLNMARAALAAGAPRYEELVASVGFAASLLETVLVGGFADEYALEVSVNELRAFLAELDQ